MNDVEIIPGYIVDWQKAPKPSGLPSERYLSTEEASFVMERSAQWVYWILRNRIARNADDTELVPMRVGSQPGRRRFTMTNLTDIVESTYRRGNLREDEAHRALKRILYLGEGLELSEIADLMPWPKSKLEKLIRSKDVTSLRDLSGLKAQMVSQHSDLMQELRSRAASSGD